MDTFLSKCLFLRRGENRSTRPEKNLSEDENQQQIQLTYDAEFRESNPGHTGGRRVLSPLRHPCTPPLPLKKKKRPRRASPRADAQKEMYGLTWALQWRWRVNFLIQEECFIWNLWSKNRTLFHWTRRKLVFLNRLSESHFQFYFPSLLLILY